MYDSMRSECIHLSRLATGTIRPSGQFNTDASHPFLIVRFVTDAQGTANGFDLYWSVEGIPPHCEYATSSCIAGEYNYWSTCPRCPSNSFSRAGSVVRETACLCNVGYTAAVVELDWQGTIDDGACSQCSAGTYKAVSGSGICMHCPNDSTSAIASIEHTSCQCNKGHTGANGGTCSKCPADTYKKTQGPARQTLSLQLAASITPRVGAK